MSLHLKMECSFIDVNCFIIHASRRREMYVITVVALELLADW